MECTCIRLAASGTSRPGFAPHPSLFVFDLHHLINRTQTKPTLEQFQLAEEQMTSLLHTHCHNLRHTTTSINFIVRLVSIFDDVSDNSSSRAAHETIIHHETNNFSFLQSRLQHCLHGSIAAMIPTFALLFHHIIIGRLRSTQGCTITTRHTHESEFFLRAHHERVIFFCCIFDSFR